MNSDIIAIINDDIARTFAHNALIRLFQIELLSAFIVSTIFKSSSVNLLSNILILSLVSGYIFLFHS